MSVDFFAVLDAQPNGFQHGTIPDSNGASSLLTNFQKTAKITVFLQDFSIKTTQYNNHTYFFLQNYILDSLLLVESDFSIRNLKKITHYVDIAPQNMNILRFLL